MIDDNCIFCKLASGEIPTKTIYEDEFFRVILDVSPATIGHALIIPINHYQNIYELPNNLASKIMILAKKMTILMTDKLKCDGFQILQNNGEAAGQTVFHYHLHLIPRYHEDNQKIGWDPSNPSQEQLEKIRQEIIS